MAEQSVIDNQNGKPRITDKGVTVQHIAALHNLNWKVEDLVEEYELTPGEVYAALAYYYDHKAEMDQAIERATTLADRLPTLKDRIDPGYKADKNFLDYLEILIEAAQLLHQTYIEGSSGEQDRQFSKETLARLQDIARQIEAEEDQAIQITVPVRDAHGERLFRLRFVLEAD